MIRRNRKTAVPRYPLPPVLTGICDAKAYHKWLDCKADELQKRDKQFKRPVGVKFSQSQYKEKIHAAVMANNGTDPYTGDSLRWDLIGTWNDMRTAERGAPSAQAAMPKEFFLLPVADHVDPDSGDLEFEICSWIVNEGKSRQTPQEFIDLCRKVVENRGKDSGSRTFK